VKIGNQRNGNLLAYFTKGLSSFHGGYRNAHNIRTGRLYTLNLGYSSGYVRRLGVGHALHRNRCIAAYCNITHHDTTRFTTLNGRFEMHRFSRLIKSEKGYSPTFTVTTLLSSGGVISTATPFKVILAAAASPSLT